MGLLSKKGRKHSSIEKNVTKAKQKPSSANILSYSSMLIV